MSKRQYKKIINDYISLYPSIKQKVFNLKKNYGYINYTLNHKRINLRNSDKINRSNYKLIEDQKEKLSNNNINKLSTIATESNKNNFIYTQNTLNNELNQKSNNIWKSNLQFSKQDNFYCNNIQNKNEDENCDKNSINLTSNENEKELSKKNKIKIINTFNESISRTNSVNEKKHILRDNKILYYSISSNFKEKEKFNQIKNQTDLLLINNLNNGNIDKKENEYITIIPIKNKLKLLMKAKSFLYKEGIDKNENNISKSSSDSDTNINLGFKKISPLIKNDDSIFDDLENNNKNNYENRIYKKSKNVGRPILFKSIPKPKLNVNSFSNLFINKNNFL